MSKKEVPEGYIRAEDFFTNSKPNTTAEEIKKDFEIYHLLQNYYSPEDVEKTFKHPREKIDEIIKTMDPVGNKIRERRHIAAVAELMHKVVGAEGN